MFNNKIITTNIMASEPHHLAVIKNLIQVSNDNKEQVVQAVRTALFKIAAKYSNDVLRQICDYQQNNKLNGVHLQNLFEIMSSIIREYIMDLDGDVVLICIDRCINEITKSQSTQINNVEMAASEVLVALGQKHCDQVMEALMKHMNVGVVPHYTLIHTLGSLALTNCYNSVPYIKSILANLLPILAIVKTDYHKQAFSYALGNFSYAIDEYISNIDKAPDPTLAKEMFHLELGMAYDILITGWLPHARDIKVTESILNAISTIIINLSSTKITEQIPKLISTLTSLYKRLPNSKSPSQSQQSLHYVSKCMCALLSVTPVKSQSLFEPHLDDILFHLTEQIVCEPDYIQPDSMKNHSEVLRCCDLLVTYFPVKSIDYFMKQLKTSNDSNKVKILIIITHELGSQNEILRGQLKTLLVPVLKHILPELNSNGHNNAKNYGWNDLFGHAPFMNRAKGVVLKVLVLLAYHELIDGDDLKMFLMYVIKLCCVTWDPNSIDYNEHMERLEFKRMCDSSLYLLTSSAGHLDRILLTLFLHSLVNVEFKEASSSLMRCLSHLVSVKFKDTNDFNQNDLPAQSTIIVRVFSLLATFPSSTNPQGTSYLLHFLKCYAHLIDPKLVDLWNKKSLHLTQVLDEVQAKESSLKSEELKEKWERNTSIFIYDSIKQINDDKWTLEIVNEFDRYIRLYNEFSQEKGQLLICLATVLTAFISPYDHEKLIEDKLNDILALTRSINDDECVVCSKMIVKLARVYLKDVMNRLMDTWKNESVKKSMKIFSFLKDSRGDHVERVRWTILMCFHGIASGSDSSKIAIQFVEKNLLSWTVDQLKETKDQRVRETALQCITNICTLFNANRNIVMRDNFEKDLQKDDILFVILDLLQLSSAILIYPYVLKAATALVTLTPTIKPARKTKIFKKCFENIYNIKSSEMRVKNNSIMENIDSHLVLLIQQLLMQSISPNVLEEIFCLLQMWLIEQDGQQRLVALKMFKSVLSCYFANMDFYNTPETFELTGFVIGCLSARCYDPVPFVRVESIQCINIMLNIAAKYDGLIETDSSHNINNEIQVILDDIMDEQNVETTKIDDAVSHFGELISQKLPHHQLMNFIESLLNGLLDITGPSSARGVSLILNAFVSVRGGDLFHHVEDIICKMVDTIDKVPAVNIDPIRIETLRAIERLARFHPKAVIMALLLQPLGVTETCVFDCWRVLGENSDLSAAALAVFIRIIKGTAIYDEQSRDRVRIAMHQPLAAINAISHIFCWAHMETLAVANFAELFSILFTAFASYIRVAAPVNIPLPSKDEKTFHFIPNRNAYKLSPLRLVLDAFKTFLLCAKCDEMAEHITLVSARMVDVNETLEAFIDKAVPGLVSTLAHSMSHQISKILTNLSSYRSSSYEPQRVAVYTFYAEYISQKVSCDSILLESIISGLLEGQADSNALVRLVCIRGLRQLAANFGTHILLDRQHSSILAAFMNGIDEHTMSSDNGITLEALYGLTHLLSSIKEQHELQAIQSNIALRVKPFMDSEDVHLRAAAITFFEKQIVFCANAGVSPHAIREQINGHLMALLLQINNENELITKTCKSTLRCISPYLNAPNFNTLIQDHLLDDVKLNYFSFMPALLKAISEEMPEVLQQLLTNTLPYVKARSPTVRANTAFVVGLLYKYLETLYWSDVEMRQKTMNSLSHRLIQLLKDDDVIVRERTVCALANLI